MMKYKITATVAQEWLEGDMFADRDTWEETRTITADNEDLAVAYFEDEVRGEYGSRSSEYEIEIDDISIETVQVPLIIDVIRDRYSAEGETMTVGDLIEMLQEFDEDTPVYIGHDNRYTFSGLSMRDFAYEE